ncbi:MULTISPECIES: DUF1330 domain-containing protein [Pseudomonas]|jgi:uncharacterized protein (DUF1330 family)|uniref:DUF1330 domain-containing protein n=1 Tax=Pseudomonas TaxID=286 RepID=UPI000B35AFCB|nr:MULTISPECIES: DUF1330 domain-containing protein [Pseudomonas]MBD9608573.1 DUF1330 domain-containing protein [Pseudomonas sp. PDM08]PMY55712.1 DUF1330 domain-containing protein [Pseudomonas sp. FW305-53]PMY87233.1 DUF1330 domain-containing protein [Pseudomonas sp. FW303-C2]PMY94011.1 DUF1330 domain-containing protein [Pseudomonas sp. FW305-62]PNA45385.1 DUF1330 domain-containing protein [Pseudomonas sp. FW306-2-2C-A10BC]
MKLNVISEANQPTAASAVVLDGRVSQPMFGELEVRRLQLSPAADGQPGVHVTGVKQDLARWAEVQGPTMLVAFQFQAPNASDNADALAKYVADREPALTRHGGHVVISAVTERGEQWSFDGFEIIEFPSADAVGQLMQDPDYRNRTAASSAVFGGAFAMAPIQAA